MDFNNSPLQKLDLSYYGIKNQVYVKRDDLIHPIISGNKWRKLKYNLLHFKNLNKKGIINVGGPSQTVFKFASKDNKKIKKIFSKGEFPKRTDMNLRKLKGAVILQKKLV